MPGQPRPRGPRTQPLRELQLVWYVFAGPRDVGPYHPALRVTIDAHARRKRVHYQQAATVFARQILGDPGAFRAAVVIDGDPGHLHPPGDLDHELAAASAGCMPDGIGTQFDGNAHEIIT